MVKNKKEKQVSNKKYFIECLLFTIFFIVLTIFLLSLSSLVFAIISGFLTIVFYMRYSNENKD